MTTTYTTNNYEQSILQLYREIDKATDRQTVKQLIRRINKLQQQQVLQHI